MQRTQNIRGGLGRPERVLVIGIKTFKMNSYQMKSSRDELCGLVETAGGSIVHPLAQEVKSPNPATYIGSGKVKEVAKAIEDYGIDLVAIDSELSPVQNRNLEKELGVRVVDRTAVILDIFAMRARTSEGKLQVELAQLEYLAPRLVGRGLMLSQQTGRIGTRGPGETQLEYDRRRVKEHITRLRRAIEQVRLQRKIHRLKREAVPIPMVAIVGYTNAGKSTLMNTLTKAGVFVEDKLFATLDPTVRRLRLPTGREVLIADTVGFIRRLPHQLVAAFKATFEEIAHADLLLELVDASDPDAAHQANVVEKVLFELSLNHKPRIMVLNKWDKAEKYFCDAQGVPLSAITGEGTVTLLERMDSLLRQGFTRITLSLPHVRGDILSTIYRVGHVHVARHHGKCVVVDCELPEKYASKFKKFERTTRLSKSKI